MPLAPGPRRTCYTICRPRYCANALFSQTRPERCRGRGDRGCLTGDHLTIDVLRYPGPMTSARAILMARGSSVPSLWMNYLPNESCVLLILRTAGGLENRATLRQPAPSPVLHLLRLGTPLPNLPARAPAANAFTEVLLTDFTAVYCALPLRYCSAAAPDHCGPPDASLATPPSGPDQAHVGRERWACPHRYRSGAVSTGPWRSAPRVSCGAPPPRPRLEALSRGVA